MRKTKLASRLCIIQRVPFSLSRTELELFEVWEINVRQIIIIANGINSQTPKLQRALAWVLDELERN